jgi:UDP-2,4-diacetamido-2,4,6-trideoxy-beta-L-altropyranose hydrolase
MKIAIRVDAGLEMGTGHLMRCLALAQAWQDAGGNTVFVMAMEAPVLEKRLKVEGMEVLYLDTRTGSVDDANRTAEIARKGHASWVVVDGYHFGAEYQRTVKHSGGSLLAIDDYGHANHYYADIVLNQNLHAHEGLYANREPYTRLLLGTQYVLLRREFSGWHGWKRQIPKTAKKMLVTLGGSDPSNFTLKVVQALQKVDVDGLDAVVVVGTNNPHYRELQSIVQKLQFPVRLEKNVVSMPELMAWADVAVSGGGSTCWELAFMGVPSILLVIADNQKLAAKALADKDVFRFFEHPGDVTVAEMAEQIIGLMYNFERRKKMCNESRQLVDGVGGTRICDLIKEAIDDQSA